MGEARSAMTAAARSAGGSAWFERGIRVGLVAYGVIHLLIGWLALQLAFGHRSGSPDQQGALHQIAQEPWGRPLLWVIAVGLVVLALWQVSEAWFGHHADDGLKRTAKRLGSAGRVVVYLLLAVAAARTAMGEASSGKKSEDQLTGQLLQMPGGRLLVAAVGLGVIAVAVVLAKKGVTTSFDKDLDRQGSSGTSGTAVIRLGQVGYVAKGVALAVIGGLLVWAAWAYDADKAGSLDVALRTLLDQSVGPWLLVAVAAGIVCFGLYCLAWARYADTSPARHR